MKELTDIRNIISIIVAIVGSLATMYQYFEKEEIYHTNIQQIIEIAEFCNALNKEK